MESIEQRALSYARMADCRDRREMELARLDYIAGAKEEHLLLTEWKDAREELPNSCKTVLGIVQVSDGLNLYRTISYSKHLGWLCDDVNDCDVMPSWIKVLYWRPIHESELPKYYGDDDGRAE